MFNLNFLITGRPPPGDSFLIFARPGFAKYLVVDKVK